MDVVSRVGCVDGFLYCVVLVGNIDVVWVCFGLFSVECEG